MSTYAYFNGVKWVENITLKDIRSLAREGVITETTLIRNSEGQETEARLFGLVFADSLSEHILEDEPVIQPAVAIIDCLFYVTLVGIVLSFVGVAVGVGMLLLSGNPEIGFLVLIIGVLSLCQPIITAMLLVVLKYFALCFGQIEKNTRKE